MPIMRLLLALLASLTVMEGASDVACELPAVRVTETLAQSMLQTQSQRTSTDSSLRVEVANHPELLTVGGGGAVLDNKGLRARAWKQTKGGSFITKQTQLPPSPSAPATTCQLPVGGVWCEVRLQNLPPFWMAVYDSNAANDVVSNNICRTGHWEENDMAGFGVPGEMMDIGGNIGYQTFSFARAGWNVTTFEPMKPNLDMIGATMCRNPDLAARIRLQPHGLGTAVQQCQMFAPAGNVGDGFTRCADKANATMRQMDEATFVPKGTFDVKRLDQVLINQSITKVDIVKIDVEGYEYQVFQGAPQFLAQYRPRVIKSEVWGTMVGMTAPVSGLEYLGMFENAGYKFFRDARCTVPMDAKTDIARGAADVIMCLK
jgi:FkbM family methyltransferase